MYVHATVSPSIGAPRSHWNRPAHTHTGAHTHTDPHTALSPQSTIDDLPLAPIREALATLEDALEVLRPVVSEVCWGNAYQDGY